MNRNRLFTRADLQTQHDALHTKGNQGIRRAFGMLRKATLLLLAGILLTGTAAAEGYDFSDMDDLPLPDGTLRIYELSFSLQATVIDIRLFPAENCQEAAEEMAQRYGNITLTDGQGKTMAEIPAEEALPEVGLDDWETERWACSYTVRLEGMDMLPESIGIRTRQGIILRVQPDKAAE